MNQLLTIQQAPATSPASATVPVEKSPDATMPIGTATSAIPIKVFMAASLLAEAGEQPECHWTVDRKIAGLLVDAEAMGASSTGGGRLCPVMMEENQTAARYRSASGDGFLLLPEGP